MTTISTAALASLVMFPAAFVALLVSHYVADYWLQTSYQAANKGRRDWTGHAACGRHVATHTVSNTIALAGVYAIAGIWPPNWAALGTAVLIISVTHFWADKRYTLARLAKAIGGAEFYAFGTDGHGHATCMGTGAAHLDQAFHILFLGISAGIIAATL